jgi:predicted ATPase
VICPNRTESSNCTSPTTRRLAVFAGGFTLEAACDVCADLDIDPTAVLQAMGRLVDKSLIVVDDVGFEGRYRLLETIRQFAAGRLREAGEEAAVRGQHFEYFVGFAETAEHGLVHVDQDEWLPPLAIERENLRGALDWALDSHDPGRARRLAAAMVWLWYPRGHTAEGLHYLQTAIAPFGGA